MRILVGLGSGDSAGAALRYAASLALRDRGRLTVLSAVTPPPLTTWWAQQLPENPWQATEDRCAEELAAAARSLPRGVPVTTLLRRGDAAQALIAELRAGAYDTVVVGNGWRRAARLLRHTHVPVVVVPAGSRRR